MGITATGYYDPIWSTKVSSCKTGH